MSDSWSILHSSVDPIIKKWSHKGFESLSQVEQTLLLVWSYSAEVSNGGHPQFFFNSFGEFSHQTVKVLLEIDAPEYAKLLQEGIDLFPNGVPQDIDERNEELTKLPDETEEIWEKLDDQFFNLGEEKLGNALLEYQQKYS